MNIKDLFSGLKKKEAGWQSFFGLSSDSTAVSNKELYFGIIYSCIDSIANGVSENEWGLYRKGSDEQVINHPIIDLLNRPNDQQTATDFFYLMSAMIETSGQFFIYPIKSGLNTGKVLELHLLDPSKMQTVVDQTSPVVNILGYTYSDKGKVWKFEPDQLINVLRPNPYNQALGISTIQMARFDGTNELNSIQMNNAFYDNGAYPGGVLKTEQPLNPDVFNKLKAQVKSQYEGKKNAFRMMFLSHGLDYQQISPSQRDMQYVEQRKLNRDQILSIFKVPKSMVAVSDAVNRATAEAENLAFARNVIKPRLELIFDKLNYFLLPLLGGEGLELRFENPIKDDQEFELKEQIASVNVWRTVNEVRQMEDLPPIEGGDELSSTQSQQNNRDEQPLPPPSGDDDKEPTDGDGEDPENQDEEDEETGKKKDLSEHNHKEKEVRPSPDKAKGTKAKEYQARKNKYIVSKEKVYALALNQHISFLIRDIKKKSISKAVEDDFEWSDEVVFDKVMPNKEQQRQWQTLLTLLIISQNTSVWKTALKQLEEIYGYKSEISDLTSNFISREATKSASSISKTVFNKVRSIINNDVTSGIRDLRAIKDDIAFLLADQKEWKIDQIARTELANAYGEVQMQTYRDNHIEKIIWIAGTNACEKCKQNDGIIRKTGYAFPSGNIQTPAHINCACDTNPYPY